MPQAGSDQSRQQRGRRLPSWTRIRLDASLIIIQIMVERCRAGNAVPASSVETEGTAVAGTDDRVVFQLASGLDRLRPAQR
jgi:hypothetical protein